MKREIVFLEEVDELVVIYNPNQGSTQIQCKEFGKVAKFKLLTTIPREVEVFNTDFEDIYGDLRRVLVGDFRLEDDPDFERGSRGGSEGELEPA